SRFDVENSTREHLRRAATAVREPAMATNPTSRPKGRSIKSLRTVWGFALHYPGHIAIAALALLVAAGATSGVPYAFKLIIDKGFASGGGSTRDIARWFEYLLLLVGVM